MLISCGNNKSTQGSVDAKTTNQKGAITAKAIENFNYTDYVLSENAGKVVVNWEKYQELAIQMMSIDPVDDSYRGKPPVQISYLKKADLSFFNGDKALLKTFIKEFKEGIPDQLRTNPIVSRSVIIETKLLKLNENLTIDNIDRRVKLLGIKDVLESFSNLNYQINKKIEFDVYDKIKPE